MQPMEHVLLQILAAALSTEKTASLIHSDSAFHISPLLALTA